MKRSPYIIPVEKRLTNKGYGLFAILPINKGKNFCKGNDVIISKPKKGTVVAKLEDELYITEKGIKIAEKYGELIAQYMIRTEVGMIAPNNPNELGWWTANHACFPNATVEISGNECMLRSNRDIEIGEEICIFYMWHAHPTRQLNKCLCGHERCNGFIEWENINLIKHMSEIAPELVKQVKFQLGVIE
jgi:hypothetical protein